MIEKTDAILVAGGDGTLSEVNTEQSHLLTCHIPLQLYSQTTLIINLTGLMPIEYYCIIWL